MSAQQELKRHLLVLGMSEETIGDEEIPQGVLLISNRPLTGEEKAYARTIKPFQVPERKKDGR